MVFRIFYTITAVITLFQSAPLCVRMFVTSGHTEDGEKDFLGALYSTMLGTILFIFGAILVNRGDVVASIIVGLMAVAAELVGWIFARRSTSIEGLNEPLKSVMQDASLTLLIELFQIIAVIIAMIVIY